MTQNKRQANPRVGNISDSGVLKMATTILPQRHIYVTRQAKYDAATQQFYGVQRDLVPEEFSAIAVPTNA